MIDARSKRVRPKAKRPPAGKPSETRRPRAKCHVDVLGRGLYILDAPRDVSVELRLMDIAGENGLEYHLPYASNLGRSRLRHAGQGEKIPTMAGPQELSRWLFSTLQRSALCLDRFLIEVFTAASSGNGMRRPSRVGSMPSSVASAHRNRISNFAPRRGQLSTPAHFYQSGEEPEASFQTILPWRQPSSDVGPAQSYLQM